MSCGGVWFVTDGMNAAALGRIGNDIWLLGGASAFVGWLAHAVLVICGVRLTGRELPAEAADYGDGSLAQPQDDPDNEPPTLTALR